MSDTQRKLRFDRAARLLTLTVGKDTKRYFVQRLPHATPGMKAWRLTKVEEDREPDEPAEYDVAVGPKEEDDSCECKAFLRWGHCRHRDGLRKLLELGCV